MKRLADVSPLVRARIAGFVYSLVFVTGIISILLRDSKIGVTVGLIAGLLYLVVTVLFYDIFKPVNKPLSLLAAVISIAGIAIGPLQIKAVHPLVFFGFYCLLIGYLVFRSTFLPRLVGVFMACSSLGWLTFLSPSLGQSLFPYNLGPGIIGEGILTLWLLVKGVDEKRWLEKARTAGQLRS